MTLHEEIQEILREKNTQLTTTEIASLVNSRGNYKKRDNSDITPYQIHGRTKNYSDIFFRESTIVGLVEWDLVGGNDLQSNIDDKIEQSVIESMEVKVVDSEVVGKLKFLKEQEFINLGNLEKLFLDGLPKISALKSPGVYAISIPLDYKKSFLDEETTRLRKNVITPWSLERLSEKWIEDSEIVYFGLAGKNSVRSLSQRLNDLLNHGKGKTSDRGPHKGGEILWQLSGYETFSLWILPTGNPPLPRIHEEKLIADFVETYGKLPFANRQL